jgi:hypothetical protein
MLRNIARQGSIVAVLLLVTASAALAAAGGGKPSSSSWISLSSSGGAATVNPVAGSNVPLFEGTTAVTRPFIHLKCYQNGSLVLEGWNAVFTSPTGSASFSLSSPAWQSGAADCTAYLENWDQYGTKGKVSVLASTSFQVNA